MMPPPEEPRMRNSGSGWQGGKKVLAVVSILIALAIGFVLMPMANKSSTEQATVVQATQSIPENMLITEDMVQVVKIPAKMLPAGAAESVEAVTGRYAQRLIDAEDYITESKIGITPSIKEVNTAADRRIISMTVPTAAAGVSGILEIGDLVSVWSVPKSTGASMFDQSALYASLADDEEEPVEEEVFDETEQGGESEEDAGVQELVEGENPGDIAGDFQLAAENILQEQEATLHEGLEFVEVAGIYSSTATDTEHLGPDIPVTVSLYVSREQAEKLVEVEKYEDLHFVFVARGENRANYVSRGEIIIW